MRKLSEAKRDSGYAYCCRCQEDFIDDLPVEGGEMLCPNNCGETLIRGLINQWQSKRYISQKPCL